MAQAHCGEEGKLHQLPQKTRGQRYPQSAQQKCVRKSTKLANRCGRKGTERVREEITGRKWTK